MKAIVFGARTPLGRALVERILKKETFSHVEAVVDQAIPEEDFGSVFSGIEDASLFEKLHIRVVDYSDIASMELEDGFFDYCGIALSASDSSEEGKEEEGGAVTQFQPAYVTEAARVAEKANIPSISLVSSQGEDSSSFYSFLSTKNEPNKKEMRFEKTVIHHGSLDDDVRWSDMDFWHDRISAPFPRWEPTVPSFHMSELADRMVGDFMDFRQHMLLGGLDRRALKMAEEGEEEESENV